ncbi:MAG: NifB/NifX family molybdenum-iron cluster-binding protein, partial [Candidatus Freyarchaeota archaeon]|nr:NifB/NifX family molybdenum-iron cluster-binding protein [Candidatus Jordarchaeia archaeon]
STLFLFSISEFDGEYSIISEHFGRAPFFAVVDVSEDGRIISVEAKENTSEHFGGRGYPPEIIAEFNPDFMIVKGMGPRAISMFQERGIRVFMCDAVSIAEAVKLFLKGKLGDVEPCEEHRH